MNAHNDTWMLSDTQRSDYEQFKRCVLRKTGIDLNLYKPQQMHRRMAALLERVGLNTFSEYSNLLDSNGTELEILCDRLTINVSELFRNPEKWAEMKERVLPTLLRDVAPTGRPLRVWSAGCSFGAEPYTLAMLLDSLNTRPGSADILATDIDRKILEKAQQGVYSRTDIQHVPPSFREKYLQQKEDEFQVVPALRERVRFKRHNLLSDPFESGLDLIVCRNVVIYFTDEAKELLFARFAESLRPGGILFVGGTERIFNHGELGLNAKYPFFYEKRTR